MLALVPLSFMLGAVVYAALAVWRAGIGLAQRTSVLLALSFVGMALWNVASLLLGPGSVMLAETVRNVLWIGYLAAIIRADHASAPQRWLAALPVTLIGLALARAVLVPAYGVWGHAGEPGWALAAIGFSLTFCIGALVFVQSIYFATHQAASGLKLILFALALLGAYELNLYASALLRLWDPALLAEGRGLVALLLAPLFAIAARRKQFWSLALSRRMTFQSLSVVAIGAYFVFVATVAGAQPWLAGRLDAVVQIAALVVVSAGALGLLASPRLRGRLKVFASKHLFEHRYDYRAEWLSFNATINSGGLVGLTPEQRAVKALADLMDVAGGLLYLREGRDRLVCAAKFDRFGDAPSGHEFRMSGPLLERVESESYIMVAPQDGGEDDLTAFPPDLADREEIWLVVPLVRMSGLVGLVALGRPAVRRALDWEDFDLLKVLGQQIATYLADARSQAELEEARQFEEFNRRFAFIIHDIKNVVSQLSLVAANAEQHGANPQFQADMASSLKSSVARMTKLLSRLDLEDRGTAVTLAPVDARALLAKIAFGRRAQHRVVVEAGAPVTVTADGAKLHTAIDHLVQNAIEASAADSPVMLDVRIENGKALLTVRDNGTGMSSEFIRRQLFKPFASTKETGFGIGAAEARALIRHMGGELDVQSAEGVGSSFIISLPLAGQGGDGLA